MTNVTFVITNTSTINLHIYIVKGVITLWNPNSLFFLLVLTQKKTKQTKKKNSLKEMIRL